MAYDAFISYSHAADGELAPALEHGLERLARPWYRLRAMAVFRDQSDLALTPHLWSTIVTKLDQSRYLVVLASPESAASAWVNKEVSHWCDTRGTEQLLLVVTGGEIAWDDATNDFTAGSTAVLPALRGRFSEEPLYHDLRWARDTPDLSLHLSRFRGAVALVASTIRGVAPDDLESEDVRLHRRARRLAQAAVTVVVVLALLASAAAIAAVRNAQRADRRAREAIARQVGLQALDEPASALDRALLLALAAAGLDKDAGSDRFRSSRMLIGRYSRLDTILSAPATAGTLTSIRALAFSADGHQLAATTLEVAPGGQPAPSALRWQLGGRRAPPTQAVAPAGPVAFVGGSSDLALGEAGQPLTVLPASGSDAAGGEADAPGGSVVALRPEQARAVVRDGDQVALVDLTDGDHLASYAGTDAAPVLTSATAIFPLAGGGLAVVDAQTGAERARAAGPPASMVVANPDGSAIVGLGPAASGSGLAITRWSTTGGQLVAAPPVAVGGIGADAVSRAVLSADGGSLLLVTGTGTTIVDPATGAVRASDAGATGVTAVDPTGRFVAMGGGRLAIWDLTHRAAGDRRPRAGQRHRLERHVLGDGGLPGGDRRSVARRVGRARPAARVGGRGHERAGRRHVGRRHDRGQRRLGALGVDLAAGADHRRRRPHRDLPLRRTVGLRRGQRRAGPGAGRPARRDGGGRRAPPGHGGRGRSGSSSWPAAPAR